VSVKDPDKPLVLAAARELQAMGFEIVATAGTASYLEERGVTCTSVLKVMEGRPNIVDRIKSGDIHLVINTTVGRQSIQDSRDIRRSAFVQDIPYQTTIPGAWSMVSAIESLRSDPTPHITSLQQLYS
jgi:carbamoyl-phosphate synthase large subunit